VLAQLRLLHDLLRDQQALLTATQSHTGQLLAITADHARLQTTADHLAQLMTLNQTEKAALLERVVPGAVLPTPSFSLQHDPAPMVVETGSPGSGVMGTVPGTIAGVPIGPNRNAIGDALNRLRDERESHRQGTTPTPGIFDDLGDTPEEVMANEQRLSAS